MAIVFISPKEKRKIFLKVLVTVAILFLVVVVLVFLITKVLVKKEGNSPDSFVGQGAIDLNLSIVDSDKVQNLDSFKYLEIEFVYVVADKDGKQTQGNISAVTKEEAKMALQDGGFAVLSLKEANMGNSNPFTPR